jgi:hypothetical protein
MILGGVVNETIHRGIQKLELAILRELRESKPSKPVYSCIQAGPFRYGADRLLGAEQAQNGRKQGNN